MKRFVVHYEKPANGSAKQLVYLTDAPSKEHALRYARRELPGCKIDYAENAAAWLSYRERRLSNAIRGIMTSIRLDELLRKMTALQTDYVEAYGPAEAMRIERLMSLTRRAAGQYVIIPPPERLCLDADDRHITNSFMQAER